MQMVNIYLTCICCNAVIVFFQNEPKTKRVYNEHITTKNVSIYTKLAYLSRKFILLIESL